MQNLSKYVDNAHICHIFGEIQHMCSIYIHIFGTCKLHRLKYAVIYAETSNTHVVTTEKCESLHTPKYVGKYVDFHKYAIYAAIT